MGLGKSPWKGRVTFWEELGVSISGSGNEQGIARLGVGLEKGPGVTTINRPWGRQKRRRTVCEEGTAGSWVVGVAW